MKIPDLYRIANPTYSFEFFPPKTDEGVVKLYEVVAELKPLGPAFCSVTWGAGGSTRGKTLEIVSQIKKRFGIEAMAHMTCVGATREEIRSAVEEARSRGIENILALRGDPPKGQETFVAVEGGFRYGNEIAGFIRQNFDMGVVVAGYPEGHIECPDKGKDLENLKRKVDAGGQVVITQLFYENRHFYDFRDRCARAGIRVPVVPGLLPPLSTAQVRRFCSMCGAEVPKAFGALLERHASDDEEVVKIGIDWVGRQAQDLLERGVPGVHFYALNKSRSVKGIFSLLGDRFASPFRDGYPAAPAAAGRPPRGP